MSTPPIAPLFDNGAAYEQAMGVWSRIAGADVLDWLAPAAGLHWLDVGCGSGAFTALLAERCAPRAIDALDPSEAQLAFARGRLPGAPVTWHQGDATALPFPPDRFDAAAMALVLFFLPDPARGVAEMVRVVRPGGSVTAYVWDFLAGGSPSTPMMQAIRSLGGPAPDAPPSVAVSPVERLQALWQDAGLAAVRTHRVAVQRRFAGFEDFWTSMQGAASVRRTLRSLPAADVERVRDALRQRFGVGAQEPIAYTAQANVVSGVVR
jgi:SAM-dependent methyltransferase